MTFVGIDIMFTGLVRQEGYFSNSFKLTGIMKH
jgi:hypothetical protein